LTEYDIDDVRETPTPESKKILTVPEVHDLVSNSPEYTCKTSVKAVQLKESIKFETEDGHILRADAGDYIVQNAYDGKFTWALPANYFEANFKSEKMSQGSKHDGQGHRTGQSNRVVVRSGFNG
jgi:hypothetical protein